MTNYLIYFKTYNGNFVNNVFIGVNDESDFDKFVNKFKERGWGNHIIAGKSEQALRDIAVCNPKAISLFERYCSLNNSDFVVTRLVDYSDLDTVSNNGATIIDDVQCYFEYLDEFSHL